MLLGRLAQGRAGQTDTMLLAESQCLPVPVKLVRQNVLWPVSIALNAIRQGWAG